MYWLILGALCVLFAVTALVFWQKWAAPWPQIEQLVSQIAGGEPPSTFLINGGAGPHRIGLALENIFARQQELERQINAMRPRSTVYQKRGRRFAAGYL